MKQDRDFDKEYEDDSRDLPGGNTGLGDLLVAIIGAVFITTLALYFLVC